MQTRIRRAVALLGGVSLAITSLGLTSLTSVPAEAGVSAGVTFDSVVVQGPCVSDVDVVGSLFAGGSADHLVIVLDETSPGVGGMLVLQRHDEQEMMNNGWAFSLFGIAAGSHTLTAYLYNLPNDNSDHSLDEYRSLNTNTGTPDIFGGTPVFESFTVDPCGSSSSSSSSESSSSFSSSSILGIIATCNSLEATIYVNASNVIVGGPNNGQPYAGVLNGTNGDDVIVGTGGNDVILGNGGNDTMCGLGGNDGIYASAPSWINGGNGVDACQSAGGTEIYCEGSSSFSSISSSSSSSSFTTSSSTSSFSSSFSTSSFSTSTSSSSVTSSSSSSNGAGVTFHPVVVIDPCGESDVDVSGQLFAGGLADHLVIVLNETVLGSSGGTIVFQGHDEQDMKDNGWSFGLTDVPVGSHTLTAYLFNLPHDNSDHTLDEYRALNTNPHTPDIFGGTPVFESFTVDPCGSSSSSSSSSSFSSSQSSFTPLSFGGDGADDSGGAHRGSETTVLFSAFLQFISGNGGTPPGGFGGGAFGPQTTYSLLINDLPPAGFGGGNVFTSDQHDRICQAQSLLTRHVDRARAIEYLAAVIRDFFGFDSATERLVREALGDASFCEGLHEVRETPVDQVTMSKPPRFLVSLAVDTNGVPLSSNDVWNQCIRGVLPLDDTGNPYNCDRFKGVGSTWYHPDFPGQFVSFIWNGRDPRGNVFPNNFQLVTIDDSSPGVGRLLQASETNRILKLL